MSIFFDTLATDANLSATDVTTGTNSEVIPLNGWDGVVIEVVADFPDTPTDDLNVDGYASVDGTNFADNVLFTQKTMDSGTDPNRLVFVIEDKMPFVRLTVARSGSTDTISVTVRRQRLRLLRE